MSQQFITCKRNNTTALVLGSTAGFGISGMEAKYVEYLQVVKDEPDDVDV